MRALRSALCAAPPLLLLLLLAASSSASPLRRCGHDALRSSLAAAERAGTRPRATVGAQAYAPLGPGGRSLQQLPSGYAPLRLLPVYVGSFGSDSAFTAGTAAWIRTTIMPAAVRAYAGMLAVQPVVGPLLAHRSCKTWGQFASGGAAVCTAYDSNTSVTVPALTDSANDVSLLLNASYLAADLLYAADGTPVRLPAGSIGFPGADTVLFVTGISTSICAASGSDTLAYASHWQQDQFDRPVFGIINLCPGEFSTFFAAAQAADAINLVMHEMAHILAFSSSLWPLFRWKDAARSPQTPRDSVFPFSPASQYYVPLNKGGSTAGCGSAWEASIATLAWVNERGMACTASNPADLGGCVVRFVTPAAAAAAATFFGCPGLIGPELENW